ncbi:Lrp/AsnC family transcriptional regulator [Kitasatospora sp. NA04385]|uniref:Lrp/AsnC family transcriptional regulator n=1 Tax=Kitasatospora sp. NA04385 TaxID=2742135 RepID=UPI001590C474|nr:Lrp/AsnC family transcriptional regulator [Kitasatospora sp. NA04385]QKW22443.1 Lrp/AsnC family transcriptional regulator [Kitasatospora sp. NA04385]
MPDDLDRKILHGLQCAPRVPFRRLGEVLGVSEQTVARRYAALRRDGVLRVVALGNPSAPGQAEWIARLRCRPDAVGPLAASLARRSEVAYVGIASGGSEIICIIRSPAGTAGDDLLLRQLPRASAVLDVNVDLVVRTYGGPGTASWAGSGASLTPGQVRRLIADRPVPADPPLPLPEEDLPLLDALAEDGRATHTRLAELTGWSKPRVARRLEALEAAGSLTYDVDSLPERLGYELNATLWLRVDLARLHRVGEEVGGHGECAFAAAISGRHNLMAVVICRDTPDFYRYLTTRLAPVEGIGDYEISVRARRLKQSASLIRHGRLIHPGLA